MDRSDGNYRQADSEPAWKLAVFKHGAQRKKILTLFGTRPEAIKLAPVIQQLEESKDCFQTVNVTSAQHTDLLYPFVNLFRIRIDYDLRIMRERQTPSHVCARVLELLDPILDGERPDLILIQGDTTTAMAGALAGFHRRIPVGHVEAGLRSGNDYSPYPEEMNRKLISRLAKYHFAATARNRDTLLAERVPAENVFLTGNPVVDILQTVVRRHIVPNDMQRLLESTAGGKRIVITTHRRESLGSMMARNLTAISAFVSRHEDVVVLFPVHPNPNVVRVAQKIFKGQPRVHLLPPLGYEPFIMLLENSWLIVSDSGGVQEEATSLHKPLLIIRENTERPEAVEAGVARLVGGRPETLAAMLEEVYREGTWIEEVKKIENPFGRGDAGEQIVNLIGFLLGCQPSRRHWPEAKDAEAARTRNDRRNELI
ncbi:MAG TPA: UDP-N-acetylglucosamine 2-epimerase (non-hydrolyzing) [Terriglobales bacterium]|nr:UDP-N-acetylglucosamine 2-epimerase (non-hydrolyzing) [Terriglobales bacterium]